MNSLKIGFIGRRKQKRRRVARRALNFFLVGAVKCFGG